MGGGAKKDDDDPAARKLLPVKMIDFRFVIRIRILNFTCVTKFSSNHFHENFRANVLTEISYFFRGQENGRSTNGQSKGTSCWKVFNSIRIITEY